MKKQLKSEYTIKVTASSKSELIEVETLLQNEFVLLLKFIEHAAKVKDLGILIQKTI